MVGLGLLLGHEHTNTTQFPRRRISLFLLKLLPVVTALFEAEAEVAAAPVAAAVVLIPLLETEHAAEAELAVVVPVPLLEAEEEGGS